MFSFFNGHSSLRSLRETLRSSEKKFRRQSHKLSSLDRESYLKLIDNLKDAIGQKDRASGTEYEKQIEAFEKEKVPSSIFYSVWDFSIALFLALIVAIILRQVLFEPYSIPTGSMRPNYRENDQLFVSKTTYGINIPMVPGHLYFDSSLLERGNIVTLTVEGLPVPDSDTTYFWLLPYKKRFIKRLIGKPGDTLYFQGGKIYGIDANGEPIEELLIHPWMKELEHIPFTNFLQVVKLFNLRNFDPDTAKRYGIDNFAQTRLITAEELSQIAPSQISSLEKTPFYLEIFHHFDPTAYQGQVRRSYLPLSRDDLLTIQQSLYTSRFVVKGEKAYWIGGQTKQNQKLQPTLQGVPDGTYEFDRGEAYQVLFGGRRTPLKNNHPLLSQSLIPTLFNLGLEFHVGQSPEFDKMGHYPPSRFAYYRDKSLYLMGAPLMEANNAKLQAFIEREKSQEQGFVPTKAPNADGAWDKDKILRYGLQIPPKKYLVLGDNHAQSGDSRSFGFVPEDNLRGSPAFNIWPFDKRFGTSAQSLSYTVSAPSLFMWGLVFAIAALWGLYRKIRNS